MKSLPNFMVIMKYWTVKFNDSLFSLFILIAAIYRNTLQIVSIRKSNLKFCTITSTKDSHQIPKNQISVVESLIISKSFLMMTGKPNIESVLTIGFWACFTNT